MEKKNTGLVVLVIVLSLLVLGLGGYIVYDKVLSDKENTAKSDVSNDVKNTHIKENKNNEISNNNDKSISTEGTLLNDSEVFDLIDKLNGYWVYCEVHHDDMNDFDFCAGFMIIFDYDDYGNNKFYSGKLTASGIEKNIINIRKLDDSKYLFNLILPMSTANMMNGVTNATFDTFIIDTTDIDNGIIKSEEYDTTISYKYAGKTREDFDNFIKR